MDPQVRLDRRYPGQGLAEPRAMATRLLHRDRDTQPTRILAGSKLVVRDPKVRAPAKLGDPRPNAPLLKRVVRYPYRQETGRPRRARIYEPHEAFHLRLGSEPSALHVAHELRYPIALGNPLKAIESRLEPRVLPTVDAWLAGRS